MTEARLSILLALAALPCACATPPQPTLAPAHCHPPANASRPQLVVGYGSLMEDGSRRRTAPRAGPAHPVDVAGFERGWFARGGAVGFSTTYLGARANMGSHLNAVAYEVDAAELAATDRRESSYCRAPVAPADLRPLEHAYSLPDGAQAWIYVVSADRAHDPDVDFPIVQSYVDVFLSGCLEQEERFALEGFARRCIATTRGWSAHWVNDRIFPRRPFAYQPRAARIDRLLHDEVPAEFAAIRIEGGTATR
jgi:hypothetical protein